MIQKGHNTFIEIFIGFWEFDVSLPLNLKQID